MQQIVVVTSGKEKVEKAFNRRDLYVVWCPMRLEAIISERAKSNILFLCVFDDDPDEIRRIGMYLRDICIEEEKIVYIYGNKEGVILLRSYVPSLFIRRAAYFYAETLDSIVDDLSELEKITNNPEKRHSILIMEEDVEYIAKLRPYLEGDYRVYVCSYDLSEVGILIFYSDIILIGSSGRFTIPESIELLRAISERRRNANLHAYFLAVDRAEREKLNVSGIGGSIAFSKDMEISRTANYLLSIK
ncbi:MAG: hypothetical protein IJS80_05905 [Lachnospiraceae bacterium]|nr:hypothetical protein [Lachnospiraceae bacterium]